MSKSVGVVDKNKKENQGEKKERMSEKEIKEKSI